MHVTLAHGTGNDFVVIADLDDQLVDVLDDRMVRALCHRRFGPGADGVLRIGRGTDGADVFMDYRNADGSIVEMCGNGVRVVAKHVVDHQLVTPHEGHVVVDTRAGHRPVVVHADNAGRVATVTVDMGPPQLDPTAIPVAPGTAGPDGQGRLRLDVDGDEISFTPVSMGNPHAVLEVDDAGLAPVTTVGPRIERHAAFPAGVNVEFAEVLDRGRVRLRVWERGVGETAACGTGACATAVALSRLGRVDDDVTIHVPGGDLQVRWDGQGSVHMTGPAVEIGQVTLEQDWLDAARAGRWEPLHAGTWPRQEVAR